MLRVSFAKRRGGGLFAVSSRAKGPHLMRVGGILYGQVVVDRVQSAAGSWAKNEVPQLPVADRGGAICSALGLSSGGEIMTELGHCRRKLGRGREVALIPKTLLSTANSPSEVEVKGRFEIVIPCVSVPAR